MVKNDPRVDLHLHTTASDGTWSPEELVSNLVKAGIELFAVTDHDSTENLNDVAALAHQSGLGFIPGVEINTSYKGRNYHILGLGIDPVNTKLQTLLNTNKKLMDAKDDDSIRYLETKYSALSFSEYQAYTNRRERGGWKALNYLIDKKLCHNHQDFFQLFKEWGNPFEKLTFAAPAEAAAAIHDAGGVSILAHPGASFYDPDYQTLVGLMIGQGIKGIECYHPENNRAITDYCLEICRENHLAVTGGSDCHGEFVCGRCLGTTEIHLSQLDLGNIRSSFRMVDI